MTQSELNLLFKKCYKSNIPQLTQLTDSKDTAQEVYQEAFYVFLKKWKQGAIKNPHNLCGYIYQIAKNKWLESKRKNTKELTWDTLMLPNQETTGDFDHLESAENVLQRKQKAQILLSAMDKLGEKCRKLLTETIVYKVALKQLQEEMGYASYNAIKVAKHQCKKSLIKHYWKLERKSQKTS